MLSCADSRVPVEKIFDMGFGDIFAIRVAGNIIGPDQLGSLEYAVEHLGVPLIMILGHTNCGAISGAIASLSDAGEKKHKKHISRLLQKIAPTVEEVKHNHPHLPGKDLERHCVNKNIWNNIKMLLRESAYLRGAVAEGRLVIYGAVYDTAEGQVRLLGAHRQQDEIIASAPPAEHHHEP